jgi:endoglucanase
MLPFFVACSLLAASASTVRGADGPAIFQNNRLGRGINLGGALEAPREGEWGVTLKSEYFQLIKEAGFNSVRIPIRWSAHAGQLPPYMISTQFFNRVDWAIEQTLSRGMIAVIDIHHYVELYKDPAKQLPRLVALWRQIASHYRYYPDGLFFELVNEPTDQLTDERWQEMFPQLLRAVRETNPTRMVIIGPGYWNSLDHLDTLSLPDDDRRLIVTFHYYLPAQFTHQGAPWVKGSDAWKGTSWTATAQEQAKLENDFAKAQNWAHQHQRPLYMGEFGTYEGADIDSRARWTRAVSREAEKHGFSWAYWEFCSTFGAYDLNTSSWREPLLRALLNKD